MSEITKTENQNAVHLYTYLKQVDSHIIKSAISVVLADLKAVAVKK